MRPNNTVTACETLALLSRFYHPSEVAAEYLYADYKELVESAVPAAQSWANEEIALCLAAGIVTERELKQLDLSRPIAKAVSYTHLDVYKRQWYVRCVNTARRILKK